jgi:PAS domain S-box-containing protein
MPDTAMTNDELRAENERLRRRLEEAEARGLVGAGAPDARLASERALRQSEERFRLAAAAVNGIVYEYDLRTDRVEWFRGLYEVVGYRPDEVSPTGAWWLDRVHPEDRADARQAAEAGCGEAVRTEYRVRHRDGRWLHLEDRAAVAKDESGRAVKMIGCAVDVTERKRAEEALRLSTERFEIALRDSNIAVFNQDRDLRYTWVYNSALGHPAGAVVGRTDADLFERPEDAAATEALKRDVIRTGVSQRQEVRVRSRGADLYYDLRVEPLRDPAGRITGVTCAAVDVTDRKRAEHALRESQKQNESLAGLVRDASQPVAIGYADGSLGLVNRAFEHLTGYTADELRATGWVNITPPEWRQAEWDKLAEQRRTGRPIRYEKEYLRKDGTRVPIELLLHMVPGPDGDPEYYYSFVTDITERKRAEAALRQSDERMRLATEATGVGVWEWNVGADRIRWDAQMFRIYGIPPTPDGCVPYAVWRGAVVPEDLHGQDEFVRETTLRLGHGTREFRIRRPGEAECRHIQSVKAVRADARGRAEWVVGTNLDVTERKRAERQLAEAHQFLHSSIDALASHIAVLDEGGVILAVNDAWRRFADEGRYAAHNYGVGSNYLDVCEPTADGCVGPEMAAGLRAVLAERAASFEFEYPCHSPTDRRWFVLRATRFKGPGPVRVVVAHEDVTTRKRAEEALKDADRRKDEFLATLAHELRNPLAPLRTGLELLRLAGGPAAAVEPVRAMMDRQLTQMVRLVDDLMDVSRISRGKIDLRRERVPVAAAIASAVETSRPLVEQMGHALTVALPDGPLFVDADPVRLAQVFLNLLTNAAKYTEPGGRIRVTAGRQAEAVVVAVRDTGIGIAADQLSHVFEMFSQVAQARDKAQGGLGIGLTLVKQLVELHGGRVEATSPGLGRGAEFVVRLPAADEPPPPVAAADGAERPAAALRVLIVDDNRDSADSLATLLELTGNVTRTAYDGEEAVAAAVAFRPDVILLDIGLPKLTGYEVCTRLREHPCGRGAVIVAQTGWATDADRARARAAGFDHHLVKPVAPAALTALLAGVSRTGTG